jgi:hypothetical protein
MDQMDEQFRNAITDELTRSRVDGRNLAVEVQNGRVFVTGTVGSDDSLQPLRDVLKEKSGPQPAICDLKVQPTLPSDSLDGRGRSPKTGTSADSAHESRHQVNKP